MRSRTIATPAVIVIVILVAAGALLVSGWTPTIPADAASAVLARTNLEGPVPSDPGDDIDPETVAMAPVGQACLDRIERSAGWLDLCWEATRSPDADAAKDYYTLRVYGTLSGGGDGVRWWTVRADLLGSPADGVFEGWPDGTIDGPCSQVVVDLPPGGVGPTEERICGRTVGANDAGPWGHTVSWTCVGCVLADHADHGVVLYEWVGVTAGTIPAWEIGADFGG